MKTNGSMVLWKKDALFIFYIVVAFFTIVGWQLTEVRAQESPTCPDPPVIVKIPDEISVVKVNISQEKTIRDKTDENWFQYYFAISEDHSINMEGPPEAFDDLVWQVYDREGNCVKAGKSGERFGPSIVIPKLGADIYFIRIIWDPANPDILFDEITYFFSLQGTSIPSVYGEIKDAFSGEKLANVTVNSTLSLVLSFLSGFYMLHIPDGEDDLEYSLDGYEPEQINTFVVSEFDYFPQDVILCPNDVVLTATPPSGDAPLTVTFDLPDVANPDVSTDFDWNFGNGTVSDNSDPGPITYFDSGTYTVNVTVSVTLPVSEFVTNEIECTVTSSVDVSVLEPPPPPPPPPPPTGKTTIESIMLLLF